MKKFIELDHTSSGVQVAAALAKDADMAATVNLVNAPKKSDLYEIICKHVNAEFRDLNADVQLARADVKAAVIAKVYAATHLNDRAELAKAIPYSAAEKPELYSAFSEILKNQMSAVVKVQKYFAYLAKQLDKLNLDQVSFPVADKSLVTVKPQPVKSKYQNDKAKLYVPYQDNAVSTWVTVEQKSSTMKLNAKSMVAKFIQSFDAYLLAQIKVALVEADIPVYSKHDAYLVPPEYKDQLIAITQQVMFDTFNCSPLDELTDYLQDTYSIKLESFDSMFKYGDYDVKQVLAAEFLIA